MRKKVLFIGMLVTLLFAFSGCGTKSEGVVTLIMSDVPGRRPPDGTGV